MMNILYLKTLSNKDAVIVTERNSVPKKDITERRAVEIRSFNDGASKFIDSIKDLMKDINDWYEIQPILQNSIEMNKPSLLSEYDNDVKDIIEKMLNIIIEEIKNNKSYDSFKLKYQKRIKEFVPIKIKSKSKDISIEEQADKVVANFAKLYVLVFSNNDLKDSYRTELLNSLHTESFLNADGYNNFNYLITKIITNPNAIKNKELFHDNNGEYGFLYKLLDKAIVITGTFYNCATMYLDTVYKLEHLDISDSEKERLRNVVSATIKDLIKKNKKYAEYELFKMQELHRTIDNRYSIKYIKDSDEKDLVSAAKAASMKIPDKREQFIFNRIIEDLQRGSLEPIKHEEMPALYENEELLIAYFRMVNYLLMKYPEAVDKKAYKNFVINLKLIMTNSHPDNKANKPLIYAEMEGLYDQPLYSIEGSSLDALFGYVYPNTNYQIVPLFIDYNFEAKIIKGYINRLFN